MNSMNELLKVVAIKRNDEDKYIIVCGNQQAKLIEFDTRGEAETYIEQNFNVDCDMLMTIIHVMFEIHDKMKEEEIKKDAKQLVEELKEDINNK